MNERELWNEYWRKYRNELYSAEPLYFETSKSSGESLLDIGCGDGRLLHYLNGKQLFYVGIDISDEILREAKEKARRLSILSDFVLADARNLPFRENSFECSCLLSLIPIRGIKEEDRWKMLREAVEVTSNCIVFNITSLEEYRKTLKDNLRKVAFGWETPDGIFVSNEDELSKLVEAYGGGEITTLVRHHRFEEPELFILVKLDKNAKEIKRKQCDYYCPCIGNFIGRRR